MKRSIYLLANLASLATAGPQCVDVKISLPCIDDACTELDEFVCGDVIVEGSTTQPVVIKGLKNVNGSFILRSSNTTALHVPHLETVGLNLYLSFKNPMLQFFEFPKLIAVGNDVSIGGPELESYSLPLLRAIEGYLVIFAPKLLGESSMDGKIGLTALDRIGGRLQVQVTNSASLQFSFPKLQSTGSFILEPPPALEPPALSGSPLEIELNFPQLLSVGGDFTVKASERAVVTSLKVDKLTRAEGGIILWSPTSPEGIGLAQKKQLSFPKLNSASFVVTSNYQTDFPVLLSVLSSFDVRNAVFDISLPLLRDIGSNLNLQDLRGVSGEPVSVLMPKLETVGSTVLGYDASSIIIKKSALAALNMSMLTEVSSRITVQGVKGLTNVNFPQLASISYLRLFDLPSLQMVSAFTLESLGEMRLFNLPKLANVTLPVLQQVQQVKLEGITLSDTYANLLVLCNTLYATAVHFSASFIWASAGEPSIEPPLVWFPFQPKSIQLLYLSELTSDIPFSLAFNATLCPGEILISNVTQRGLRQVFFPRLTTAYKLSVLNTNVESIRAPSLSEVTDIYINANKNISELDFAELHKARTVFVTTSSTKLERLEFPSLVSVTYFVCFENSLITLSLPRLQNIVNGFGSLTIGLSPGEEITQQIKLLSVELPSLKSLEKVNLATQLPGFQLRVEVQVCVGSLFPALDQALLGVVVDLCPVTQHNNFSAPIPDSPALGDWTCLDPSTSTSGSDKVKWWELGCIPSYGLLDCSYSSSPSSGTTQKKQLRITGNFSAARCVDWSTGLEAFQPITSILLRNHDIYALSDGAFDASLSGAESLSTLTSVDLTQNPLQWVPTDMVGASQALRASQRSLLVVDRDLFQCPEGALRPYSQVTSEHACVCPRGRLCQYFPAPISQVQVLGCSPGKYLSMTRPSLAELDLTSPSALLDQVCVSCPADRASSEEGSLLQDCFAINDGIQIDLASLVSLAVFGGMAVLYILFVVASKMKTRFPDSKPVAFLQILLALFDLITDLLFLFAMQADAETAEIVSREEPLQQQLITASIIFLALPVSVNLLALIALLCKELRRAGGNFADWISDNALTSAPFLVISATNISCLQILSSGILGKEIFSAPFSRGAMEKMKTQGLISHLLEDVPQITIQILYASLVAKEFSLTTSISVIVSCVSLFSGVIGKSLLCAAAKQQRWDEQHKPRLNEAFDATNDDALAVLQRILSKPAVQEALGGDRNEVLAAIGKVASGLAAANGGDSSGESGDDWSNDDGGTERDAKGDVKVEMQRL